MFKVDHVATLTGSDTEPTRAEVAALGAVIDYVALTQIGQLPHLDRPRRLTSANSGLAGGVMEIDAATRRNLELVRTLDGEGKTSLVATIDRTITSAHGSAFRPSGDCVGCWVSSQFRTSCRCSRTSRGV